MEMRKRIEERKKAVDTDVFHRSMILVEVKVPL